MQTIKMFGPSISDPTKIVNRDVPVCDEQAYKAAGYKRGSVSEVSEPEPIKACAFPTEEVPMEDEMGDELKVEPVEEKPAKPRRSKGQK